MSNEKFRVINASTNPKTSNNIWIDCSANAIIVDSNASRGSAIFRGNGTSTPTQITPIMKNLNIGNMGGPIYISDGKIETCIPYSELFTSLDASSVIDGDVPTSFYNVSDNNDEIDRLTIAAGGTYIGNGLRTINFNGINYNYTAQLGFSFESPGLVWRGRSNGVWSGWKAARAMPITAYDIKSNNSGYGGRQKTHYCEPGEVRFNFMLVDSSAYFDRPINSWANIMMMRNYNYNGGAICKYTSMFGMNSVSAKPKAFICSGDNTGENIWTLENVVTDKYEGDVNITGSVTAKSFYESSDERLKTFGDNIKVDFDKLSKLRKSYFVFNDSINKQHIGVSAQEVKEIYPEIVSENEKGHLSVDYSKLSVIALSAIDELYKQNKVLEDRLSKLEEKIK